MLFKILTKLYLNEYMCNYSKRVFSIITLHCSSKLERKIYQPLPYFCTQRQTNKTIHFCVCVFYWSWKKVSYIVSQTDHCYHNQVNTNWDHDLFAPYSRNKFYFNCAKKVIILLPQKAENSSKFFISMSFYLALNKPHYIRYVKAGLLQ